MSARSFIHRFLQSAIALLVLVAVTFVYVGNHACDLSTPDIEQVELGDLDSDGEGEPENEISSDIFLWCHSKDISDRKVFSMLSQAGNEHVQFLHRTIEVITPPPEFA